MTDLGRLVQVELLELPIPLWSSSRQLFDELMREFALPAAQPPTSTAGRAGTC